MISIGWNRKDEDGKRVELGFNLKRGKTRWTIRRSRLTGVEPYSPEPDDWDGLLETIERHRARGKVTHEDAEFVRRLREETPGAQR